SEIVDPEAFRELRPGNRRLHGASKGPDSLTGYHSCAPAAAGAGVVKDVLWPLALVGGEPIAREVVPHRIPELGCHRHPAAFPALCAMVPAWDEDECT